MRRTEVVHAPNQGRSCAEPRSFMRRTKVVHAPNQGRPTPNQGRSCAEPRSFMRRTKVVHAPNQGRSCTEPRSFPRRTGSFMRRTKLVHAPDQGRSCAEPRSFMRRTEVVTALAQPRRVLPNITADAKAAFLARRGETRSPPPMRCPWDERMRMKRASHGHGGHVPPLLDLPPAKAAWRSSSRRTPHIRSPLDCGDKRSATPHWLNSGAPCYQTPSLSSASGQALISSAEDQ
jgi:hypothetical protein